MIKRPLMPKATALWLVRHTQLSHAQIGAFCDLHPLEIKVLENTSLLQEANPVSNGQLTTEEIMRCEQDPQAVLQIIDSLPKPKKTKAYVPLTKRSDVPHAVLWLIQKYPHLSDHNISTLLATTPTIVGRIRSGKHRDMKNLVPKDPVLLGFCKAEDLPESL